MAGAAGPAAGGGGGAGDAKPRSSSSFAGAPGGRPSSTSASAGTRYSSDYSRFSHIGAGDEGSDDDSAAPGEWERERGARAGTGPGEGAGTRDAKAGGGQQATEVHGAQGGGASDVAVAATAGAAHGAPAGGGSAGAAGAPGASAGAAGGEHADNCAIVADAVDSLRPGASGSECNDADSLEDQVERHTAPPGAAPGGGCSTAAHTQSTSTSAGGDSKAVREAAEGATAVEDGDAGPSDHEVEPSYPGYDGERCADNRPHGYGVYRYKDGAVYEGYWSNGQKCSWGRQNYANGKVYEGDWRDGKWDGQGFACFPNGTKYTGGWRGNKRDGHGKQEFADGSVYEGNYCEDRREGHGKMTFADGRTYNGDWKADKWWGEGTATFPNGGRYNGGWRDDRREGTGKETFAAGGSYEGGWVSDRREGLGREVWPNGDVYEGEYVQGQMEGHGICRYADGRVYEGEWRKGKWWGEGTAIFANGNKYSGGWRASRREGRGKQVYHSDNGSYDGDWLNDKKHGRGLEIWGNGDMYEGEYKDGHRDGHGVFTSHTGEVYEGKFKEGKRHGQGKLTKPDLTEQWGVWHHGAFQGKQLSDRASSARAHLQAKLKQRKQAKNGGDVDGNAGDASVEAGSAGGGSASAAETGRHKRAAEAAEAAEAAAEAAAAELLAEEENTKKAAEDKKKRKQQKAKDKKRAKAEAERAKAEAERAKEAELAKSEAEKTKAAAEAKKVAEAAQAKASEKAPEARKDAEELKPAAQAVVKAPAPGAAAAVVNEGAPAHASAPQISAAITKIGALNLGATTNAVHTAADNSDEWEAVGRGKKKKNKNRVTDAAGDNLKPPNAPMPPAFGPRAGPDISGSKFQGRAASVPPLGGATSSRHVAAQHQLAHAKQQGVPRPLSLEAGGRAVPPMTKLATMPAGHDLGGGSHGQPGSEQNSRTKIADHSQAAQDVQKTRTDLSSLQHPRSAPARTVPADMPVSTTTDLSRSEPAARLSGTRSAGPALQAAEKQQAAMAGGAHVQQASGGRGPPSATQVNSQAGRSHAATPNVPMNADGGPSHAMPQLQPGTASQNYGYSLFGGVVGGLGASFGGGTSASTFGTTAGGASYSLFGGPGLGSVANPPAHLQPSAAKMHQHHVADVSATARGSESARSRPGEGTQRLSQAEQQQASVHQQQQHHHQQQRQMQPQPQQQPPQHAQRQQQRQQLLQQQQQQQAPDLTQATVQHHQQLVQQQLQMGVAYGLRMPQVLPGAHAFNAVPDVGAKGTMFGAVHPDSARVQFMHARDVSSSGGAGSAGGVRAPANMHAPAPPSTVLGTGGGRDASTQQHMQAGVYAGHTQGAHPEFRASAQVIQAHAPFGQAIQHRPQSLMYGQYSGSAAGGVMHSTGPGVHVHVGGGPVAAHPSLPAVGHVQPSARPRADAQMNLSGASAPNQDASSYGPGV